MGGASVHFMRAALAVLALLGILAGLLPAALLLLARLLTAALLPGLTRLLTWLIALLLLTRFLVGILILRHSVFLQRCWCVWLEATFELSGQ
jgi:hypothetical protein